MEGWIFQCIIHEETLRCKLFKIHHMMELVKTVKFICARDLNNCQIDNLLNVEGVGNVLAYHTELGWLSRGNVLKGFLMTKVLAIVYHTILMCDG